jgi:hypothetical protein
MKLGRNCRKTTLIEGTHFGYKVPCCSEMGHNIAGKIRFFVWHETQLHFRTEEQLTIVQETGNNILK